MLKYKGIIFMLFLLFIVCICELSIPEQNFLKKVSNIREKHEINRRHFTMYVKENGDANYKEYIDSDFFPSLTKYSLNLTESYCIDKKDNVIKNAITFSDSKVIVTSNKTMFCYLYFDGNLFDIETDILVQVGDSYKSVNETPTSAADYNYNVRYDCSDNNAIVSFGYDYKSNSYTLLSSAKNKCNIYFEPKIPDIEFSIYVDGEEVMELSNTTSYVLDNEASKCTDINAIIDYDDDTKEISVSSSVSTKCDIYLKVV